MDTLSGQIGELYPTVLDSLERVTFPVERVSSRALLDLKMLEDSRRKMGILHNHSDLWQLQLAVFEARMEALKAMIRRGYQPVGEARIYVDIRVEQKAVSVEAGDIDHLPDNLNYVTAYRGGSLF